MKSSLLSGVRNRMGPDTLVPIIIPDEEIKIACISDVSLEGKDITCIQAKRDRLGMYLMGQAILSKQLQEERFRPKDMLSIARRTVDNSIPKSRLERYDNVTVIVMDPH